MAKSDARIELTLGDVGYPQRIAELRDAPKRIYARGDVSVLGSPALGVVGSRRATPYGLALAEMASQVAAESGLIVVSGGAMGCDQAAGFAALKFGAKHVIVLGTGADVAYPKSVAPLIERTLDDGGAVLSLEPWGTEPMRWAFPKRNRVIAALCEAVFVAEAGMPSGTFSTAEAANEIGREVLAAPGSILSPESRGSNYLISVGACCVADIESLETAISRIYGTLRYCRGKAPGNKGIGRRERAVLEMLVANPMRQEEVSAALHEAAVPCLQLLSGLEMSGLIERLVDGRFSPTKRALHALTALGQNG